MASAFQEPPCIGALARRRLTRVDRTIAKICGIQRVGLCEKVCSMAVAVSAVNKNVFIVPHVRI